jgi:hypothetical protein
MGLSLQLASGARTPPISSGKGSGAATCHQGGDSRANPATCPWQKTLRGTPTQQPH